MRHSERIADVLRGVDAALSAPEAPRTHGIVRVETPDGIVAVIGPVVDRLVASGHVIRRADGRHHGPSKAEVYKWVEELAVCDFCSAPHANHILSVPDFDMVTGRSVGGWAACDDCDRLVKENKRADLLRRAIDGLAPVGGKWSAAAIQALHRQFWQAQDDMADAAGVSAVLTDFIEDRLPNSTVNPILSDREKRAEAIRRLIGITADEQAALERGDLAYGEIARKLVAWRKKFGKDYQGARLVEELLRAEYRKPVAPGQVPHWERALAARFEALQGLRQIMASSSTTSYSPQATDLNDPEAVRKIVRAAQREQEIKLLQFPEDERLLRAAETYSFNAETIGAIREAATSIPHESPLSSIETPNIGCGWFWFSEPLPVVSASAASQETAALLWGWVKMSGDRAAIRFSTYIVDANDDSRLSGQVVPATRWYWPLELSFHDMLAYNVANYRRDYGEGGKFAGASSAIDGEDVTMRCVGELSLFFLAACMWFKQRIIVPAQAHVERHARKRYQREHKLAEPPRVQVVALRAALREPSEHVATEGGTRNYTCRWIVKGHPRLQAVGPGRAERKLIWIDPHPAGPSDKPLRVREKVYAVIR